MSEQRNYRRIGFRTEAHIDVGANSYPCELVDLALQGALFKSAQTIPLPVEARATLKIFLPDSAIRMTFEAELIHQRGDYYGFLFVSEDADSMAHLRRLLELNFGDAEQAEQEFSHWLKQEPKT